MKPFYDTPEKAGALEAEARRWVGTPFVPHAMIRGAGVDCVHLIAGIYVATGALKKFDPPKYALDEGLHLRDSKLLNWFSGRPDFQVVGLAEKKMVGDALCFHLGRVEFHAGLMLANGNFIHVLPKRFVLVSNLRESFYARRITAVFRPVSP